MVNSVTKTPLYDTAGNLTTDKDGYKYTYDYENRIIEIKYSSNNSVAEFAYDALGRRIKKYDAVADGTTYYYYNDKWQVFAEFDSDDDFRRWYVYGNYIDEVLFSPSSGGFYYCLHDHLYGPVALVNGSGTVIERYEYNAYGEASVMSASYEPRATSDYNNPTILLTKFRAVPDCKRESVNNILGSVMMSRARNPCRD